MKSNTSASAITFLFPFYLSIYLTTSHEIYAELRKAMQLYAKLTEICRYMQKYAEICRNMQEYAGISRNMQKSTYSIICKNSFEQRLVLLPIYAIIDQVLSAKNEMKYNFT